MELIRCFICLELPRESIEIAENIQNLIKKNNLLSGKYTDPENLHLTLKFLGEIDEVKLKIVQERLEKIKFNEFEASLGEVGVFSKRALRILWIKLFGKSIWGLQEKIDESLTDLFPKEERFMSHITLARMKKVYDRNIFLNYIKNIKTPENKFAVKNFILKKSELKPEGPIYTDLGRYNLC